MITKNTSGNNISSGFISQIQSDSPNVIARLWHNNAEVSCDIVNITVEKGSCGQTTFMVGDVIGDMLTATVKGLSVDLKGELIECHIGALVNGSYEYISLGRFRVSEVKKTRYQSEITAYSRIVADTGTRLDVTGLNNPTIAQIAAKVAGKLNCTVTFDTGINTSYQVGAQLDGLTYYQALQVIAICCGGYVVNTNDGNVRVHRFSTTANLNVNTGMMVKLPEIAEQPYKVETVGVLVSEATTDNNGNPVDEIFYSYNPDYIIVTKQGTDYYLKARSGQLILANLKPESADIYFSCQYMTEQMFKNNIMSIRGYEYYPAQIGLTLGDPRLEGCDVLNVTDVDGNTYTVPCHKIVHKYTGGFTSEITSCDASDKANSVGTSFPITQRFETQARQIGTAQATADNAYKIAGDTNQYFWFTGSGSDTGAHITETPQAQFIANPQNGGGNLLARSNGVAIRDGLTELATFGAYGANINENGVSIANFGSTARVGKEGSSRFLMNADSLQAYNGDNEKYFEVSPDGMTFGVNNVASQQYVDDAETDAISTASADATSKANTAQANAISTASADATAKANTAQANAEKVATNFITTDSTGIKVHNTNDTSNYTHIGSSGLDVHQSNVKVADFGLEGQHFNNDYGEEILTVGKLPSSVYGSGQKLNWFSYNNESPFTVTLPWGNNGVQSVKYYDSSYTQVSISPTYSVSGRNVTFPSASCQTMQSNGVKFVVVGYTAVGRFPYYTIGSDGVGAIGKYSFREGENTVASGNTSHAEGESTVASGDNSHAEGSYTKAIGSNSHAEGNHSVANGRNSHAGGLYTVAEANGTAVGQYNVSSANGLFVVGNGTADDSRSNAFQVNSYGHARLKGNFYAHCDADSQNGKRLGVTKITTATFSSLPFTVTWVGVFTADMEVIQSVLSNPSAQTGDWTVTTATDTITITGSIKGSTNITLYLVSPIYSGTQGTT